MDNWKSGVLSAAWISGSLVYFWKVFPCSLLSHIGNFTWDLSKSENGKWTQFYLSCFPFSCVLCSGMCLYIFACGLAHVWVTWTCTCMYVEPWGNGENHLSSWFHFIQQDRTCQPNPEADRASVPSQLALGTLLCLPGLDSDRKSHPPGT